MKAAPGKGGGDRGFRSTTGSRTPTTSAAPPQEEFVALPELRERLIAARRRLVERIAEDWADDRRFPDSGWTRMLSDIQAAIEAVDAVIAEFGP